MTMANAACRFWVINSRRHQVVLTVAGGGRAIYLKKLRPSESQTLVQGSNM